MNLREWARALHLLGGMVIKPSSWSAVRAPSRIYDKSVVSLDDGFSCPLCFNLHAIVTANGNNKLAYDKFVGQLRGCFHANSKVLTNPRLGLKGRLLFWRSFV